MSNSCYEIKFYPDSINTYESPLTHLGADIDDDNAEYKELLRKCNLAFLQRNKTEMSKLNKEMKRWRYLLK